VVVSLGGCHLLGGGLVGALVPGSLEALVVELAVGLVRDEEVKDRPDSALEGASNLPSKAAVRRLVQVTTSGLQTTA
jgi:hypothetical protein